MKAVDKVKSSVEREISEIRESQIREERRLSDLMFSLDAFQQGQKAIYDGYVAQQDRIFSAFLKNDDGDPDLSGHAAAHKAQIELSQARRDFWNKLTFELSKWGMIGFLAWMISQAWIGMLKGPHG